MGKKAHAKKTQNKLIYVGNFIPPYSTENYIKKTFEKLGWVVDSIQESEIGISISVDEVIERSWGCKFLLYTRTWTRTGALYKEILEKIKIPTVSFHLDLYLGISRGNNIQEDTFFGSDYVFSADGGHQREFKKLGINHYWLPPAIYEGECYLAKKTKREYQKDVIFVGSYYYHKEWPYRRFLIDWLKDNYGKRFFHVGENIEIRGPELNILYASAKVVVGDSLYSPYYWSDRVPETIGRGGFLVHPLVDGLDKYFVYGRHLIPYWYGDFRTLKTIIDYYIEHDSEREKIKLAGYRWVKKHHTYTNRVRQMLKILKNNGYKKRRN